MKPWPVQPRAGFTPLPNEVLARAIGLLTPEQLRLFLGLVYAAEWKSEGGVSPDGRWRLGWAQTLVGLDALARTYGMKIDAVRRALRRFASEGVALATLRAAPPATPPATSAATPPTLVDFGSWYGIPAAPGEAATPPATPPATEAATSPAPIQEEKTGKTTSSLREEGAPAARRPRRESAPAPEGFQRVVRHWFEAWERAGRGKHASLTQAEGAMVKALLRELGPDEVEARIDRAFRDPWFLEHGDLGVFRRKVQAFAPAGSRGTAPKPTRRAPPGPPAWVEIVEFAAADSRREGLQRDLCACTAQEVAGELVITPADVWTYRRLVEAHRIADVAAAVVPGAVVRMVEPPAAVAAGGAA